MSKLFEYETLFFCDSHKLSVRCYRLTSSDQKIKNSRGVLTHLKMKFSASVIVLISCLSCIVHCEIKITDCGEFDGLCN